jgi:hypothetical protein
LKCVARWLPIRSDFCEASLEAIGLRAKIDSGSRAIDCLRFGGWSDWTTLEWRH